MFAGLDFSANHFPINGLIFFSGFNGILNIFSFIGQL